MMTIDPEKKAQQLSQIVDILTTTSPAEDLELILSFARVVFGEFPDRLALQLLPEALAERLRRHFRFVAREIPSATQVYRGLPGLHVTVRTPSEEEALAMGAGAGLPLESTFVETHTVDAPFIFDSLKNYFSKAGLRVFSALHPIFTVRRQWEKVVWIGGPHDEGNREVFCSFQIEPVDSRDRMRRIEHEIVSVLKSVFLAVEDYPEMMKLNSELSERIQSPTRDPDRTQAVRDFLRWLGDENYIFFGTAGYRFEADGSPVRLHDSVTGVFKDEPLLPVVFPGLVEEVESYIPPKPDDPRAIMIDFCKNASAIYHLEPVDYIIVRHYDSDAKLTGATLYLGRFARGTFVQRADRIPLLKWKLDWLLTASDALPNSHIYREIRALFNRMPMRELFYAPPAFLKAMIDPIVFMVSDDEISIQSREAAGYVALSISFSRLRYSYGVEKTIRQALSRDFGPIAFHTEADCGPLSLMIFYFDASRLDHDIEIETVRSIVEPLVSNWEDRVAAALEQKFGEREGRRLLRRHVSAESRSGLYREVTPPEMVPDDVHHMENLETRLEAHVVPRSSENFMLHLYSVRPLGLTATLRTLQNLGLTVTEELRIPLVLPDGRKCYLYRFEVQAPPDLVRAVMQAKDMFVDALRALDEERTTDDPLNGLILRAGLAWREVDMLRTLRNHLLQIRLRYNTETLNSVLLANSGVAKALFQHFAARFDPAFVGIREAAIEEGERGVLVALRSVSNLAEDEILHALDDLISCVLRTNYYQKPDRPVLSIKVDSRKVEGMTSPRPMFEIYVHSRLLEGIHLRGGKVARGGIRWSDRHDDFRTEVLGLMKTQMVKNAIIVPVGSKGGFVLKGHLPSRPALDAYLIARYREYVSGLLDITDNIVDGKTLHPPEVVRHDADDPYLVVAADKGTAHLSDTANSVSNQYGFWLGDAFASGGSVGYDHKKVGITSRGVWECVKHNFRNLGIDVQKEPFTVCGIGDMAGDVFGNGMLQSPVLKLIGAFNHAHIFVDPQPDSERSFRERQRLFRLTRSTWLDYDRSAIGKGGGIFDRYAKAIPVSSEMREAFDIDADSVSGEEMIRRILTARVDLLFNGGIGTYVKATAESNADVGDHSNDRVRVNATDLRCRVVAEGGNLGFTQKARLEFWANGGFINTDALDNSGGVDMSDHEVNLKILMDMLVKKDVVKGKEARNSILAEMTEEVAGLVLADNANQSRALTLDTMRSSARYEEYVALIEDMVGAGIINRVDENIPTREELLSGPHKDRGLPRPLLAVLLGYSKMKAFDLVMNTGLPDSPNAKRFLIGYFPKRLQDAYANYFVDHVLRREIVATGAVNYVINNGGITLLPRLMAGTQAGIGDAIAAYLDVDRESGAAELRTKILAAGLAAKDEHEALLELENAVESSAKNLLLGDKAIRAKDALADLSKRLKL